ncbi:Uncharacterised protein [Clostridium tertium]|uniref:Uncharacterized protein n=2 Tax=Clostridium tertium TaxID=1559 RepID=A0A6N3GR26_9CLOT
MYNEARTEERNKISRFFRTQDDFETEKIAARAGVKKYKSGGRLMEEYDLSNWKWVCVKRNDVNFLISLQTFDRDPSTGNLHILMDKIGIYAYVGNYSSIDAQTKMMITNIELPLDDNKLNELGQILRDLSECDIYKLQVQYEKVCANHRLV